ncbi:hypothetical protein Hte_007842 [Hypoxylon texense]
MVYIAVSPVFTAPLVKNAVDTALFLKDRGNEDLKIDSCRNCSATETKRGGKLLECARCKARRCSVECQRADWKKHKTEGKLNDAAWRRSS